MGKRRKARKVVKQQSRKGRGFLIGLILGALFL
jgi:hypothetical protein